MSTNLATEYLSAHNESIADYDGCCGELAGALHKQGGGDLLYVDGETGDWWYHMALLRDGLVHDAWCEGEALSPREWLIKLFGPEAWVEVSLNGDTIFEGLCKDFQL